MREKMQPTAAKLTDYFLRGCLITTAFQKTTPSPRMYRSVSLELFHFIFVHKWMLLIIKKKDITRKLARNFNWKDVKCFLSFLFLLLYFIIFENWQRIFYLSFFFPPLSIFSFFLLLFSFYLILFYESFWSLLDTFGALVSRRFASCILYFRTSVDCHIDILLYCIRIICMRNCIYMCNLWKKLPFVYCHLNILRRSHFSILQVYVK